MSTDHVHIVVSSPPKYSIAGVAQLMKQSTGRALREKYKFLRERYRGLGGMWLVGYFASTVGLDEETIPRYVRYQEKDLGQAKLAV
jgi:putative transposase